MSRCMESKPARVSAICVRGAFLLALQLLDVGLGRTPRDDDREHERGGAARRAVVIDSPRVRRPRTPSGPLPTQRAERSVRADCARSIVRSRRGRQELLAVADGGQSFDATPT